MFIDLIDDCIFKSVFQSMEFRNVVSKVISYITGISKTQIYHAHFQGGELPKQNKNEKGKASDIIINVSDTLKIVVEMNKTYSKNIFKKNTDYAFNILTRLTKKNRKFIKVILINIDNFNYYKQTIPILGFNVQTDNHVKEHELYKSYHIILDNIVNYMYNKDIDKDVIKFFDFMKIQTLEELKEKYGKDIKYMKAVEKVEDIYNDPNYIGYYYIEDRHKMELEDWKETGIDIGKKQGAEAKTLELAKNFKDNGVDVNTISKATGLSLKKIKKL